MCTAALLTTTFREQHPRPHHKSPAVQTETAVRRVGPWELATDIYLEYLHICAYLCIFDVRFATYHALFCTNTYFQGAFLSVET